MPLLSQAFSIFIMQSTLCHSAVNLQNVTVQSHVALVQLKKLKKSKGWSENAGFQDLEAKGDMRLNWDIHAYIFYHSARMLRTTVGQKKYLFDMMKSNECFALVLDAIDVQLSKLRSPRPLPTKRKGDVLEAMFEEAWELRLTQLSTLIVDLVKEYGYLVRDKHRQMSYVLSEPYRLKNRKRMQSTRDDGTRQSKVRRFN